jgi:hypothetical protein
MSGPDPEGEATLRDAGTPPAPAAGGPRRPISMHENVAPWADHCSCGAEPYWLDVAEELGIDVKARGEDGEP